MKTRRVCILSILFLLFIKVSAQTNLIPKYEIGILGGAFVYQGDLTPNALGDTKTMHFGFGIYGSRTINRNLAIRLQLLRGRLRGDDGKYDNPDWRQHRNFNFKSPATELSAMAVWNIPGLNANDAGIINFSPYVFGGLGYSFLKIKRDWSEFDYAHFSGETGVVTGLTEDINHKVQKGIFEIPFGFGVRYGINEKLSFNMEGTYRLTNTDYLDGFSQAANPDKNDHYHTLMFGLIYSFGKRNKWDCPVMKN